MISEQNDKRSKLVGVALAPVCYLCGVWHVDQLCGVIMYGLCESHAGYFVPSRDI